MLDASQCHGRLCRARREPLGGARPRSRTGQATESSSRNEPKTSAERAVDASTSARAESTKRVGSSPDSGRSELPEKRTNDGPASGNGQSNSILDANRGRNVNISA